MTERILHKRHTWQEYIDYWKEQDPVWIKEKIQRYQQRLQQGRSPGIGPEYSYRIKVLEAALKIIKKKK
jgi:hypothetical protein